MNKKFLLMLFTLGFIGEFSAPGAAGALSGTRGGGSSARTPDRKETFLRFTAIEGGGKTEVFSMGTDLQFSQDGKTYSILNARCVYANGKLNLVYTDTLYQDGEPINLKFLSSLNYGTKQSFFAKGTEADSGNCYIIYVSPEYKTKLIPLSAGDVNSILSKKPNFIINSQYKFEWKNDDKAYLITILPSPMGDS